MASLRNAIPRITHKERAAPKARKHLGLLEKKKDYIERARDFQKKVGRIKDLRKKAAQRNPDEFYYGMINSKTTKGVHEEARKDGTESMSHAEIRLLKDQDASYLRMKQAQDEKKAARLQQDLHLLMDAPVNKHTLFLESDAAAEKFDPAKHFDTDSKLAGRAYNRPRTGTIMPVAPNSASAAEAAESGRGSETLGAGAVGGIVSGPTSMKVLKKVMKQRDKAYRELAERLARAEKLKLLAARKETEKLVMGSKGSKRKVKDATGSAPAVYKWKRQRAK